MNKRHYKVIFSRVLNQLVVVSELAKSQGKAQSENVSSEQEKTGLFSTALSLNPIHFSLMLALGFVFLSPSVYAEDMAIRADKSAPGNQQPTVLQTGNGLPQVNIQTPSAGGVSRNQYSQFDVAEKGAVLNNARKAAQTQMAGWVQGNPNLARGEAKVILNEVNSANPSRLKGYVEVAGKKADVVIANPSGIQCDGCGVINAGRTTLTTGKTEVENGELKGYRVKGGKVTVGQKGMDNSQSDYTDIIADKAEIKGGVWSKKGIKVTTGKNNVDRTNDSVVYVGDKNTDNTDRTSDTQSENQSYSVDVSQLGGMYAEKIHLVDNGQGLGVRNAGHIGASAGNVKIDSQGRIINEGVISAIHQADLNAEKVIENKGKIETKLGGVALRSQTRVEQHGSIVSHQGGSFVQAKDKVTQTGETVAKGDIQYQAKNIEVKSGALVAAGVNFQEQDGKTIRTLDESNLNSSRITLRADNKLASHGKNISTGKMLVEANEVNLEDSQVVGHDVDISSKQADLNIDKANIYATEKLNLFTPKQLSTKGGHINANLITTQQRDLNNQGGNWVQRGASDLVIHAEQMNNQNGGIGTQGRLLIKAGVLNNQQGQLVSRDELQIHSTSIINTEGKIISGKNQYIESIKLDNQQGVISSQSSQQLQIQQHINNREGRISGADMNIRSHSLDNQEGVLLSSGGFVANITSVLNNAQGIIKGTENSEINAQEINNNGGLIYTAKGGQVKVVKGINNQNNGRIISLSNISIQSSELDNRGGVIQVAEQLSLSVPKILNNKIGESGSFIQANKLTINTESINNQGTIDSSNKLIHQGISASSLTLNAQSVNNAEGGIYVQNNAQFNIAQSLNNQKGDILSWRDAFVKGDNLAINNDSGRLQAGNILNINSYSITENGHLEADKIRLNLQSNFNTKRDINAGTELTINTFGNITNNHKLSAEKHLNLNAQNMDNQKNGRLSSVETRVTAKGKVTNRGLINSFSDADDSKTVIKATHIDNVGSGRIYGDHVALQADKIENRDEQNTSGEINSATIAGRQKVVLAGKEIINDTTIYEKDKKGGSTIYSGGRIEFGARLNANDEANGKADVLRNKSSIIEAEGGIGLKNVKQTFNTNEHFDTTMMEYPDEGNKNEVKYVMVGAHSTDFNVGGKVKEDRFDHRRIPGKNKPGVYDLVWKKDLNRKLTNDELEAGYIPQANQNTCAKSDPSLCYVKPTTLYDSAYGIWKRFGVEAPKDAPSLENLPGIRSEPVKPRALKNFQVRNQRRKAQYDEAMAKYDAEMLAYKKEVVAYNEAVKPYINWVNKNKEAFVELNNRIQENNNSLPEHYRNRWIMQVKEEKVIKSTVKTSLPGQILAGGDIEIGDSYFENDKSTVISGGLISKENGELKNLDKKGIESHQLYGTAKWEHPRWRGRVKGWRWYGENYNDVIKRREENHTFDMNIFTELSNANKNTDNPFYVDQRNHLVKQGNDVELNNLGKINVQNVGKPALLQQIESQLNTNIEIRTIQPDTRLPTQSLYKINPNVDSHFIIETDPDFTNKNRWLSSDYMLKALRNDPQNMLKRLGDGYYEQRLVREQMNRLTGRHFSGNNRTFTEQYKALMDAGITFAQKFNLAVGVSLTPAQVAQLTSDIVWIEKQTVILPSGKKVEALVPRVYAVVKKGDVDGNGTLISAEKVYVKGSELSNQGTIAGKQFTQINTESLINAGKLAGGVLNATVAGNLDNIGGVLEADRAMILNIGGDFSHRSTMQTNEIQANGLTRIETNLDRKALLHVKGKDGLLSVRANNINLEGADVLNDGSGLTLLNSKNNLNLTSLSVGFDEKLGNANSYRNESVHEAVVSRVKGKGDVLLTGKNILSEGAQLDSEAKLMAIAENDLVLNGAKESRDFEEFHKTKSGSVAKVTKTSLDQQHSVTQVGTQVSGKEVLLSAGHDVKAKAIQAIADDNLHIQAGHDVDIAADTNHFKNKRVETKKTSGVFTGGGIGITFGSKSEKHDYETEGWTQSDARSTLGSMNGNIRVSAGNHTNVLGTDMITPRTNRIDIEGASVKVEAGKDIIESKEGHEYKQAGLTIAVTSPVVSTAQSMGHSIKRSREVKNEKLKQLHQMKAAYDSLELAQNAANVANTVSNLGNMTAGNVSNPSIKVSISVGASKSTQTSESKTITHSGSELNAGTVNLTSRKGDVDVLGSTLNAKRLELDVAKNLNVESVQDTYHNRSENKNTGWSVGVFAGANGNSYGIGVEGSAQVGKGHENSDSVRQRNSYLNAEETVIKTGKDANFKGAVVKTDHLDADIKGNLNLESRQDSNHYDSKQTQAGAGFSVAIYGSGSSASANYSQNKAKVNYAQVEEQTGFHVGKGGMDVKVAGNTHLAGSVIDSEADQDKNHFKTKSLTHTDIENRSEVEVKSVSAGLSTDMAQNAKNAMAAAASALGNKHESATSQTQSAIGSNIQIDTETPENLTALSRDTQNANHKVKAFDHNEVKEQQEAAQVAGELFAKVTGDLAKKFEFEDGSKEKIAMHALAGALAAKMSDGNVATGAAAGASSEWLNTYVTDYLNEQAKDLKLDAGQKEKLKQAAQQMTALVIGAAAGAVTGGSSETMKQGALTSYNAETYNRQLHQNEKERIKLLANGDEEKERRLEIAACALVHCSAQIPTDDPDYAAEYQKEILGNTSEFANERALLSQQKYLWSDDAWRAGDVENMFDYNHVYKASDAAARNRIPERTVGLLQSASGVVTATAGAVACLGGTTCVVGTGMMAYGGDNAYAGFETMITGKNPGTLGGKVISTVTNTDRDTSELIYGFPSLFTGGKGIGAVKTGIKQAEETLSRGTINSRLLGNDYEYLGHGVFKGPNGGLAINTGQVDPLTGQAIFRGLNKDGSGANSRYYFVSNDTGKQIKMDKPYELKISNSTVGDNKIIGDSYRDEIFNKYKNKGLEPEKEVLVETSSGIRTRIDVLHTRNGNVRCTECKASLSAPLTKNQRLAFPEIEKSGAVVISDTPTYSKGTVIKPHKVIIERKKE